MIIVGENMIDINAPAKEVEVSTRDGTLWVNVDGVCRLRISDMPSGILRIDIDGEELSLPA